jgi:hypothetical protein
MAHHGFQYTPVTSQNVVDISDKVVGITVHPVVVGISAGIAAESLVGASFNRISAFTACFVHTVIDIGLK